MMRRKKALTLVELILVISVSAILLLGASQLIIAHARFSASSQIRTTLLQEVACVIQDTSTKIKSSKYADIGTPNTLLLYGVGNTVTGTYTWSGNNLYYNSQLVSNKLDTLAFSDASTGTGSTITKLVRINVTVKDPRYPNIGPKAGETIAYCRISGAQYPVRLVNSSGTERGKYNTIQAAVNAASGGDTVQISSNGKIPYEEKVKVTKNIILRGTYNCDDWSQGPSVGNPDYETIIDGQTLLSTGVLTGGLVEIDASGTLTVEGLTIKNNYDGPGLYAKTATIYITRNIITQNNNGIQIDDHGGSNTVYIYNNLITQNCGFGGIYSIVNGGTVTIANNKISNNMAPGVFTFSITSAKMYICNNLIEENASASMAGGIYATGCGSFGCFNNIIQKNDCPSPGSAIYCDAGFLNEVNCGVINGLGNIVNNAIRENKSSEPDSSGLQSAVYVYYDYLPPPASAPGNFSIKNNLIQQNPGVCPIYAAATYGGSGNLRINNNKIVGNDAGSLCAGIHIEAQNTNCRASLMYNLIENNTTTGNCNGIDIYYPAGTTGSQIILDHNTIANNTGSSGGAIYFRTDDPTASNAVVKNTISYFNSPNSLYIYSGSESHIDITYSDIYGYTSPPSPPEFYNVSPGADPKFVGGSPYDYHLITPGSPCAGTGESSTNMGCYPPAAGNYEAGLVPLPADDDVSTPYITENIIGPC